MKLNRKKLEYDEIRVIKLDRKAVSKILWETFMDVGADKLELPENEDDGIFRMTIDDDTGELVFYACNMNEDYIPDFDYIDEHIASNIDITTKSIYEIPESGKHYKTIFLPANKKGKKTGDGSVS